MQICEPENTLPHACALEFSNEKVPIWTVCVNTILDFQSYWNFPRLSKFAYSSGFWEVSKFGKGYILKRGRTHSGQNFTLYI